MTNFNQKIFIIGSTGFIGFALTKKLLSLGFKNIFCSYRYENKRDNLFKNIDLKNITFIKSDLNDFDSLKTGIVDASVIINTSGYVSDWGQKKDFVEVNVECINSILKTIKSKNQKSQYIHITSASIYGFGTGLKTEIDEFVKSDEFYTFTKVDAAFLLRMYIKILNDIPITVIAPTIVWGEGDQIYIPAIQQKLKQRMLCYISSVQKVNFVHIDDLVTGIIQTINNSKAYNQEFIMDGPSPFYWKNYIDKIAEFSNLLKPIITIPYIVMLIIAIIIERITKIINIYYPDIYPFITKLQVFMFSKPINVSSEKAKKEINYNPKIDFDSGIQLLKTNWHE